MPSWAPGLEIYSSPEICFFTYEPKANDDFLDQPAVETEYGLCALNIFTLSIPIHYNRAAICSL